MNRAAILGFFSAPRFAWLDLVLVVSVCLPVWTRTPVGGAAGALWHRVTGLEGGEEPLTAYFQTGPPPEVGDWAMEVAERLAETPVDPEELHQQELGEPVDVSGHLTRLPLRARLALQRVFAEGTPEATVQQLEQYAELPEPERIVALVEDLLAGAAGGDLEAALEVAALGRATRERAVGRAISAGLDEPERLETHRRFLAAEEARVADTYVAGVIALATALDLAWPVTLDARVTSRFGERVHPVLKTKKFHNGVDVGVSVGTPVFAAQGGQVAVATQNDTSGMYIILDHGHGVRTAYCHLSALEVAQGARVERGQQVALSGNTGRSTGPHLHYITRLGGKPVDPLRLHRRHP